MPSAEASGAAHARQCLGTAPRFSQPEALYINGSWLFFLLVSPRFSTQFTDLCTYKKPGTLIF